MALLMAVIVMGLRVESLELVSFFLVRRSTVSSRNMVNTEVQVRAKTCVTNRIKRRIVMNVSSTYTGSTGAFEVVVFAVTSAFHPLAR